MIKLISPGGSQKRRSVGAYLVNHVNEGLGGFSGEVIGQSGLVTACDDRLDLRDNLIGKKG
jgi:hypothetical protein